MSRAGKTISELTADILFRRFKLNPHGLDMRLDSKTMNKVRALAKTCNVSEERAIIGSINLTYAVLIEEDDKDGL